MACAGLKECELDNSLHKSYSQNCVHRVISLALEMMKYSKQYTWGEKGIFKVSSIYIINSTFRKTLIFKNWNSLWSSDCWYNWFS